MNKQSLLSILGIFLLLNQISFGQDGEKEVTMFIFGHSLIHHELQVIETPSQETSIPHWMHFLSEEAGNQLKVSGQYGFLPQHANLPPIAQWGFDFVEGAWESDYETFAQAEFTHILLTPGNFIQWQPASENYPYENISPVSATNDILNWCDDQIGGLNYYIYENWPDMAAYLGDGFPPSISEWSDYNQYLQSDFVDWFDDYHQIVKDAHPAKCVKLIPVGRLISELLETSPFDEINISELYEDDAPHGRPSIYFLASLISYMAIYEEKAPESYQASNFIDPIITNNYQTVIDFFWNRLLSFNDENGASKVFCKLPSSNDEKLPATNEFTLSPNPVKDQFRISNLNQELEVSLYDCAGRHLSSELLNNPTSTINVQDLPAGVYTVKINTKANNESMFLKLVKVNQ